MLPRHLRCTVEPTVVEPELLQRSAFYESVPLLFTLFLEGSTDERRKALRTEIAWETSKGQLHNS